MTTKTVTLVVFALSSLYGASSFAQDSESLADFGRRPRPPVVHPGPGHGPGPRPPVVNPRPRPRPPVVNPGPGHGPGPRPPVVHPGPGHGPGPRPPVVTPGPVHPRPPVGNPGYGPGPRPRPPGVGHGHHHPPAPIHGGIHSWPRWYHPPFARPIYQWNWPYVRYVTCTAQDSWGNQYPVTESSYYGYQYQTTLWETQDAALSRCYYESQGDSYCFLVGCIAGY